MYKTDPAPALKKHSAVMALVPVIVLASLVFSAYAQSASQTAAKPKPEKLFESEQTLDLTIRGPWNEIIRDKKNQQPYPANIEFTDHSGQRHSIPLTVGRRGLTRQTVCKFPPIKLQFDKNAVKGTIFRGQKTLKMVTHCDRGSRWEQYYIKEMLAYRIYSLVTDLSFRVRPLSVTYIDSGKNSGGDTHFAFLIEDDGAVAKRNKLKKLKVKRTHPKLMDSQETSRMALFQYMIGNPDWSALKGAGTKTCCHNGKLFGLDPGGPVYAVPYDFDSSGLVDAHYAVPNAGLPIKKVTQRLYRGFCAHNPTLETARREYLAKEQAIYALVTGERRLNVRSAKVVLRYLNGFFDILRDDDKFDKSIIQRCRK